MKHITKASYIESGPRVRGSQIVIISLITLVACQHRHASEENYRCQTVDSNLGRYLINTQPDGDEHSRTAGDNVSATGGFKGGQDGQPHPKKTWIPTSFRKTRLAPLEYKKPYIGRDSAADPTGRAYSAPTDPLAGGAKASFPFPKNPTPAIDLLDLWLQPFGPHPTP